MLSQFWQSSPVVDFVSTCLRIKPKCGSLAQVFLAQADQLQYFANHFTKAVRLPWGAVEGIV